MKTIATLCLLFGLLPSVRADLLSTLPQDWQPRLQSVPESDLSGAEGPTREQINQQRQAVAQLLREPATQTGDLAEGYGRLGALYQVFLVEAAAQACYQNAMQLDPANFRWRYYAGYLASQSGRHPEAIQLWREAAPLQPDYAPLQLRIGASLLELNRLDEASALLAPLAEQPGLSALALYYLAQIDLLRRDFTQAIGRLRRVLELDPKSSQAHHPLARALRATGQDEAARQHMAASGRQLPALRDPLIEELLALNQGARRLFSRGLRAAQGGDFAAAALAFAEGLEITPDNRQARISYARALLLSGETERAAEQLELLLSQDPKLALARFLRAVLWEYQGEPSAARAGYQQLLTIEPGHQGAHFCLANLAFGAGEYALAADHYAAALQGDLDIPPARLYQLLALKRSGAADADLLPRLRTLAQERPKEAQLGYALIRLLGLSEDPRINDAQQAGELAQRMLKEAPIPPHLDLAALMAAAGADFATAVKLQQELLASLAWAPAELLGTANGRLEAYQRGEMPKVNWQDDPFAFPPPVNDARLMFREYQSAVPY